MGDRDRDSCTRVYVGGLSDGVKKEDLEGEFEKFGKLNNVWVAFNPPGFAFIEFISQDDAETACDTMNGIDFLGSKLRVEIARGKSRRGGGGGGGGFRGGYSSRGGSGFRGGYGERSRGGGFRGGRGGGRGGNRYDDYGGGRDSSDHGGYRNRDYRANGEDRGFRREGRDSYRGGSGGGSGGRHFESDFRYRSRSPAKR